AGELALVWHFEHRIPVDRRIVFCRRGRVRRRHRIEIEDLAGRALQLRGIHQSVAAHPDDIVGLRQIGQHAWSSVTTILANLVGRSVVPATPQPPASGRFGPLTPPPRSLSPTVTPAGAVCCAASRAGETVSNRAAPITATLKYRLAFGLIDALLVCLGVTAPPGRSAIRLKS